ncbi:MAG: hypothetical protein JJU03_14025 [Idiomarina sp.]|nr:hypothetical protein [Idiomarina sp.]
MRFSERYGHKKVRDIVQIESVDEPLKNALWSILKIHIWDYVRASTGYYSGYYLSDNANRELNALCKKMWFNYFKEPLDTLEDDWQQVILHLRAYFFKCEWYELYDFVEFCANNYERYEFKDAFTSACNAALEKEMSAYRFVAGQISQITEQEQLDEIEQALEVTRGPVHAHLIRALELLSSREKPDYRNSIKESVCAVESLVSLVLGSKGTLGQLIKKLEDEINLHPALKTAFSSLYGYTSDEGGIRHALLESEKLRFEDAKFFMVVCSAFINFVESKVGQNC